MTIQDDIKYRELLENIHQCIAVYKAVKGGEDFILSYVNHASGKGDCMIKEPCLAQSRESGLFEVCRRVWAIGKPETYTMSCAQDQGIESLREHFVYKLSLGEIIIICFGETVKTLAEDELKKHSIYFEEIVKKQTAELRAANEKLQRQISEEKRKEAEIQNLAKFPVEDPNPVLRVDAYGKVLYANKAGLPLLAEWGGGNGEPLPEECFQFIKESFHSQKNLIKECQHSDRVFSFVIAPIIEGGYANLYGRDITELKQAEKNLKLAYAELEKIFNTADGGMVVIDRDFIIRRINDILCTMLGISHKEKIIGKKCQDVILNSFCGSVHCPLSRIFSGEEQIECYAELKNQNGAQIPCILTSTAFRDDDGKLISIVENFKDITEYKKMEAELQKIHKLESVGVLAGGIAHDFNNALTIIMGNVSLAKLYTESDPDLEEVLTEAEKALQQAKNLTSQLLTFSSGGAPVIKKTPVARLLKDAASLALSGSRVQYRLSLPDELWWAEIDERQINQAIGNVLVNADQAMPEGGIVDIKAENAVIAEEMGGLPLQEGKYIKISIGDQGVGIPKKYLHKIFDPYFSTKEKKSGLGLAIAYSIIKKHKGYITTESEVGVGTTFYIYLPASDKEVFPIKETVEKKAGADQGGDQKRILFMDDQEGIRNMVELTLRHLGYEVGLARDGAEALELYRKAKESGRSFDAVIVDLTVPGGMGGKDTMQKLRDIDPDVKVIIASGYFNDPIMAEYRRYGFSDVVSKPFDMKDLQKILHRVLQGCEGAASS